MDIQLYRAVLAAIQVSRKDVFGTSDDQLPVSEPEDATIPQIGFIGHRYYSGGTLLLGINPGGGGNAYSRTAADSHLLPLIQRLRDGEASPGNLKAMFDQYIENLQSWNLWRIVNPTINACGITQHEIAYLNWCPFRTRGDALPQAHAMRRSRATYLAPLVGNLAPGRIIALGKKVGNWLEKEPLGAATQYVVPRTIGDSRLSSDAIEVLEEIRRSSRHGN